MGTGVGKMDDGLDKLFDYTKFHIGLFTLTTLLIAANEADLLVEGLFFAVVLRGVNLLQQAVGALQQGLLHHPGGEANNGPDHGGSGQRWLL